MSISESLELSSEFVEYMRLNKAWPRYRIFDRWMRENKGSYSPNIYKLMKKGHSVPDRYIYGLLEYVFLSKVNDADRDHIRNAILSFVRSHGWADPNNLTPQSLYSYIVNPDELPAGVVKGDVWKRGWDWMGNLFAALAKAELHVMGCYPPEEAVRRNVHWMVLAVGRAIANDPNLPAPKAVARARELMQISEEEYYRQALKWRLANPWTVIFSRDGVGPLGQSIILPVTEQYYGKVFRGEAMSYDCTPDDIQPASRFLILEASFERPKDDGGGRKGSFASTAIATLAQIGALSQCDRLGPDEPLTILAFAAHPLATQRLKGAGFIFTGTKMAKTGIPFMERKFDRPPPRGFDFMIRTTLNGFASALDGPPPP